MMEVLDGQTYADFQFLKLVVRNSVHGVLFFIRQIAAFDKKAHEAWVSLSYFIYLFDKFVTVQIG